MNLAAIIDEIASRADEFLLETKDRAQGRAGIAELLTMDYAFLNPADRKTVIDGVMAVLEEEDFFGVEFVGDTFVEPDDEE